MSKKFTSRFKIRVISNIADVPSGYISLTEVGNALGKVEYNRVAHLAAKGQIECCKVVRTTRDSRGPVFIDPNSFKNLKEARMALLRLRLLAVRRGDVTQEMIKQANVKCATKYEAERLAAIVAPFTRPADPVVAPIMASEVDIPSFVEKLVIQQAEPEPVDATAVTEIRPLDRVLRLFERQAVASEQYAAALAASNEIQTQTLAAIKSLEARWS